MKVHLQRKHVPVAHLKESLGNCNGNSTQRYMHIIHIEYMADGVAHISKDDFGKRNTLGSTFTPVVAHLKESLGNCNMGAMLM